MTPAGRPRGPYDSPAVRHRWIFVAFVVFWWLMVVSGIVLVIRDLRDHVPFDFSFWLGTALLVLLAAMLIRVRRLRRSARH